MLKLIHTELLKLKKSMAFRILLICQVIMSIFLLITMLSSGTAADNHQFSGLYAFHTALSDQGLLSVIISLFAAFFICGEYSHRTIGMALFSGHRRREILLAKIIILVVGACIISLVYPIALTALFTWQFGFGAAVDTALVYSMARSIALYLSGCAGITCFLAALAVLIQNLGGTIGAGIIILLVLFGISGAPAFEPFMRFTMLWQLSHMALINTAGQVLQYAAVAAGTIVLTVCAAIIIFERSELK